MVNNAETTAKTAEADAYNDPGMCLQQSRIWAGIGSKYSDDTTAWKNTHDRYPGNRTPPRGSAVYWTGGSHGYGHIAISLGNGKIRSTDAGGSGKVATVDLGWVESHWGLPYAGWAWDINEVTIPHSSSGGGGGSDTGDDDVPYYDHGIMKTDTKMKAGTWVRIKWDKVTGDGAMDVGSGGVHIGTRRYSASAHFTVEAPKGATLRAQVYEYEKGDSAPVESNPTVEFTATDGNSYFEYNHNGAVAKERGLLFQVQSSQDATLLNADVVVLSWKP